jgi:hypothetical protein
VVTDNGGIKITISASVAITDGKVCIPQCLRDPQTGYNNDAGDAQTCNNTITLTAVIENTGFPGALSSVSYNWLVNGSGSGTGNGGIEPVGSPTAVIPVPGDPSKLTTSITVKSKASNWNWTPGSVGFSYQVPPVPIFCPDDPINPISTCPGFSGAGPTLIVYKDGTYPPVEGTDEVIMGPKCVKIGDIVSFTVYPRFTWVPTAFPDSYQWNVNETNSSSTFPFGLSWLPGLKVLYWSGDRSSVTVLVEQNFAGGNLNVVAGTANSCNDDIYTLGYL